MNVSSMKNTPSSRENFERNMYLLVHKVKSGTFHFGRRGSPIVDHLLKVRRLPNGRLDLLSVDEGARLAANTVANMDGMARSQRVTADSPPSVDTRLAGNRRHRTGTNSSREPEPLRESKARPAPPRIGILAYGSLISDSQVELRAATADLISVKTPFRVEFARLSNYRGQAPTLVRVEHGGSFVNAVVFILKPGITEAEAKSILWRRETRQVGSGKSYVEPSRPMPNSVLAKAINVRGIGIVVYTDFPEDGKLPNPTASQLAEYALASAKNPKVEAGLDGISYLIEAWNEGIVTPLMAEYRQEILKQTHANSLKAALAKVTSGRKKGNGGFMRPIQKNIKPQPRDRSALQSASLVRFPHIAQMKQKVGRNDPCPCGSGMKFKKCCRQT